MCSTAKAPCIQHTLALPTLGTYRLERSERHWGPSLSSCMGEAQEKLEAKPAKQSTWELLRSEVTFSSSESLCSKPTPHR